MITELIAQIEGSHDGRPFTAGIVLWNNQVVEAKHPAIRFLQRMKRDQVRVACVNRGWKIRVVREHMRP